MLIRPTSVTPFKPALTVLSREGRPLLFDYDCRTTRKRSMFIVDKPCAKIAQPQFRGLVGVNVSMFYLDLDSVDGLKDLKPVGIPDEASDFIRFEGVYRYCEDNFGHMCLVMRTMSGKVKLGFMMPSNTTDRSAIETMRSIVGSELVNVMDRKALRQSFIRPSNAKKFGAFVANGPVLDPIDEYTEWQMDTSLPETMSGDKRFRAKSVHDVLCFILGRKHSTSDTIFIPIPYVAKNLKRVFGRTDESSVQRALNKLIELGVIEVANSKYIPGQHGRLFRILDPRILDIIAPKGQVVAKQEKSQGERMIEADNMRHLFTNGNWFEALKATAPLFDYEEDFDLFVQTIRGHKDKGKGRMAKAKSIWKWLHKQGAKPTETQLS